MWGPNKCATGCSLKPVKPVWHLIVQIHCNALVILVSMFVWMCSCVICFILTESLYTSPSQQSSAHHGFIRAQPKRFPGDAGLSATEPITAKPATSQPITQLAWRQRKGAERAAQLSLFQEERIRQQCSRGGQGQEGGDHRERWG